MSVCYIKERIALPSLGSCSTKPGAKLSGGLGIDSACSDRAKLGGCGGGPCPALSPKLSGREEGPPDALPPLPLPLAPGPELLARLASSSGLVSLSKEFWKNHTIIKGLTITRPFYYTETD